VPGATGAPPERVTKATPRRRSRPATAARREHQQCVGAHFPDARVRVEHEFLLALVRAARDPDRPAGAERLPQRAATGLGPGRQLEVELEVADHVGTRGTRAEPGEPRGVGLALRRDHDAVRERLAHHPAQQPVAAGRARRDARAREHQRQLAAVAGAVQVRPQLGLENDSESRPDPVEEAAHRPGQVVGQVADRDVGAKQAARAAAAGRRRGRQRQRQRRVAAAQRPHQARRRLHLADRHRVHPQPAGRQRRPEAEALGQRLPVAAVADSAPQRRGEQDWHQAVAEADVE
jgi:hypothetical protein